jgi:hypothetical protein
MNEEESTPLESLTKKLYTNTPIREVAHTQLPFTHETTTPYWKETPLPIALPEKQSVSFAVKFLIGALLFALIAGGVAAYVLFGGKRAVSSERIDIVSAGPSNITSGDSVHLTISIRNNNPEGMKDANLVVTLPPNSRRTDATATAYDVHTESLGEVGPGVQTTRSIDALIFGTQGQTYTIPLRLTYHVQGSSALFTKEGQYSVTVTNSPIRLEVASLSETTAGQSFTQVLTITSNATKPLEHIGLLGAYPTSGFSVIGTSPKQTSGTFWDLGTMAPGEKKTITITGSLQGIEEQERAFTYVLGKTENETRTISLPYATSVVSIKIRKPFLSTSISLNRDTTDPIVISAGNYVDGLITWQNNLNTSIANAQVLVTFSGSGVDLSSVQTTNGFYRSSDSTLVFSKETTQNLALLNPGDTGTGSFSFTLKKPADIKGTYNPIVEMKVSVSGNRTGEESTTANTITSGTIRTIQVGTTAALTSRLVHQSGPFLNTGTLPPLPNKETTYSVLLEATNSVNTIAGAKATMTLPPYVRFSKNIDPADANITYDESSRSVTWTIGELASGKKAQAAFQVALLPSVSQSGTSPIVVSEQVFSGTDRFTKKDIMTTASLLTTQMTTDSSYDPSFGIIGK